MNSCSQKIEIIDRNKLSVSCMFTVPRRKCFHFVGRLSVSKITQKVVDKSSQNCKLKHSIAEV